MLEEKAGRFSIRETFSASVPSVEFDAIDEPLSPQRHDLQTYEEVSRRARDAKGYLTVLINEAARERANDAHRMLTNLVAKKLKAAGAIPKFNRYVDMSAFLNETPYLFEMKSTRDENAHDQVRKAISQLYEYRYLQDTPTAKLVVVIQNPLPQEKSWLVDYLMKDRQILIAWDGDGKTLHSPLKMRQELGFFA